MQFYVDPALISIGVWEIRYYGLVYALGVVLLYWIYAKHRHTLHLTKDQCSTLVLWIGIGMLIGARIFHFLFNWPSVFFTDPLELFRIQNGGMSFYGAFLGSLAGGWLYLRNKKTPYLLVTDLGALVVAGTIILGRITNFVNQELPGRVTDVAWCMYYAKGVTNGATAQTVIFDTVCRHPYALYAAISHIILFALMFYVYKTAYVPLLGTPSAKKSRFSKSQEVYGLLLGIFIAGYGLLRFIVDFWREDPILFGLTNWQYVSLVMFVAGIVYIYVRFGKNIIKRT